MEVNQAMGFGKFLLGGLCVVGSVVAAPVVLPSAGLALMGAAGTGAIGTAVASAGLSVAAASTTTLVGAGAVGGAVLATGVTSVIADEKEKGRKEGYVAASKEFADKFKKQEEEFLKQTEILRKDLKNYQTLLSLYEQEIKRLQSDLSYYTNTVPNSENALIIRNRLQTRQDEYKKLKRA